jgi:hypothetical protein
MEKTISELIPIDTGIVLSRFGTSDIVGFVFDNSKRPGFEPFLSLFLTVRSNLDIPTQLIIEYSLDGQDWFNGNFIFENKFVQNISRYEHYYDIKYGIISLPSSPLEVMIEDFRVLPYKFRFRVKYRPFQNGTVTVLAFGKRYILKF